MCSGVWVRVRWELWVGLGSPWEGRFFARFDFCLLGSGYCRGLQGFRVKEVRGEGAVDADVGRQGG